MAARIDDVARRAGVSTATVSRALRGLPSVAAATRTRVLQAAAELDYIASPSASSLASGHTRTIGLVTPSVSRWFHGHVIEGAERTLRAAGFDVLLHALMLDASMSRASIDPTVLRRRVDGVLVVGLPVSEEELAALEGLGVPLVFVGAGPPGHVRVHMDDVGAARMVVEELVARGHRRIGQVQGTPTHSVPWSPAVERAQGAEAGFAAADTVIDRDDRPVEHGDFSVEGGRAAAARLLDRDPGLTAVYAHSDEMAFGVLAELEDRGVRVPEDMSVVGIDGHDLGGLVGLATMAQDASGQGAVGATLVLEMLAGAAVGPDVLYPVTWVPRRSVAPVRTAAG